jgi:lambda family phage portal protein
LRRERARAAISSLELLRDIQASAYRGASSSSLRDSDTVTDGSADADLLGDLDTLRERSRDLTRNNPLASGVISGFVTNVVGVGYQMRPAPVSEALDVDKSVVDEFKAVVKREWKKWTRNPSIEGGSSLDEIARLAFRSEIENGDCFSHFVTSPIRAMEKRQKVDLHIELIEADRVDTPLEFLQDDRVRKGVFVGRSGETRGFYVSRKHPGDKLSFFTKSRNEFRYVRARLSNGYENVIQLFEKRRIGQHRGEPLLAPVLSYFDDLDAYLESELIAKRVEACISAVIKTADPAGAINAALAASGSTSGVSNAPLVDLEPGTFKYLGPGEEVQFLDPSRPGSTFDMFVMRVLRAIYRGLGLPYEMGAMDFSQTNYSSARAAILEARTMFTVLRTRFRDRFYAATYKRFLAQLYVGGHLPMVPDDFLSRIDDWSSASWVLPGWGWVDPVKEVDASIKRIDAKLSTPADEAAQFSGRDWYEMQEDIADQQAFVAGLGAQKQEQQDQQTQEDHQEVE